MVEVVLLLWWRVISMFDFQVTGVKGWLKQGARM